MKHKKLIRVMCLAIAGVMTFSILAGVVMQVAYLIAA